MWASRLSLSDIILQLVDLASLRLRLTTSHDCEAHRREFCRDRASPAKQFCAKILGLSLVMDFGGIATFETPSYMAPQVNIASEGGAGTPVPDLSIKVDDLDEALRRVRNAGFAVEYGPAIEDWGVRRFYVRDPFGRLVNVLAHV